MNETCPCVITGDKCQNSCTCANPVMSGGCWYCPKYGSAEQRLKHAEALIATIKASTNIKEVINSSTMIGKLMVWVDGEKHTLLEMTRGWVVTSPSKDYPVGSTPYEALFRYLINK